MTSWIGSDSHGDADTIPEDLEEDYFPPNFKEYLLMEHQLKWSRHKEYIFDKFQRFGWVFWSQQDHEIEPSLSLDNCADNIRLALDKLISYSKIDASCLVQFWAATKTLEGRTKLTTQYQPFALSPTWIGSDRRPLCEYRVKMCREYNCFYADAESGEEQLGLPGRVFLQKSPESSPNVKYYSTKEYPQYGLAVSCNIKGSWAVPVFEDSSQTCVGVLEMVSLYINLNWRDEYFLLTMRDIFQESGLQCFDGYNTCEMHSREEIKRERGLTCVFQELKTVLSLVCGIHRLPLAMAWVPCSACNGLRSMGVECCASKYRELAKFLRFSERSHLRKGWVARRALSYPHTLYFPNITELSIDEYPLVPYARMCEFSGWFIFCLQSIKSRDKYVLEFFWSSSTEDSEDTLFIQERLSELLGTMEERLGNFLFTSGEAVGALTHVEIFNVQNKGSCYEIQADRTFSSRDSHPSPESSVASVSNYPW